MPCDVVSWQQIAICLLPASDVTLVRCDLQVRQDHCSADCKMDDDSELCSQIKQLVVGFTSHVHDVESVDEAQNTYMHMEEYDRDFDRYDFVKTLRASIEDAVGSQIDNEIDRRAPAPGHSLTEQESLVNDITNKILHSRSYGDLLRRVREKVDHACDYLLDNFDQELAPSGDDLCLNPADRHLADRQHRAADMFCSDVEAESSIGDSLNQSAVIFMNSDQQKRFTDGLSRSNGVDIRKSTMKELMLVTSVEVQNCEAWSTIRSGVRDALLDDDDSLWLLSLRFVARGLSTNNHEVYGLLIEFLQAQFSPVQSPPVPAVRDGLNLSKPRIVKIFKAFRLLNSFLQMLPHYSQRYQENTLNVVLEPTLTFLDVSRTTTSAGRFLPMHFLSLVDCKAAWFVNLLHSEFSRSCLLRLLKQHPGLVESAVRSCHRYISAHVACVAETTNYGQESRTWRDSGARHHYTWQEVDFAHFMCSLRIVGRLIMYEHGRRFFPVGGLDHGESVSVTQMVVMIVQLVTHVPESYKPGTLAFDPHHRAVDIMQKLCSSEDVCHKVVCRNAVTDAILEPIWHQVNGSSESRLPTVTESVVANVATILAAIASTRCGHQHLLYGEGGDWRRSMKEESRGTAPVHVIVKFALKALTSDAYEDILSRDVVSSLLDVCRLLYCSCEGLYVVVQYGLHYHIASAWRDAKRNADNVTPTPQSGVSEQRKEVRWEMQLCDDLLNFAGTPKGVLLLQQTGVFRDCVLFLYSRYERKLQVSNCEKFGYGYLMSQVAATAPGILALDGTGFTRALIRSLWGTLEVVDDGQPCVPRCWPVGVIDKLAKKPFVNMVNLLSSFLSVCEILEHDKQTPQDSDDESDSSRFIPSTISEMLNSLVFIDSVKKIERLFNFEQSHVFGLRLLSVLTSCLDTMLLIEEKFAFQELLLRHQAESVVDKTQGIIFDMMSLERNYILVKTYWIGGPSERRLPPRTIENKDGNFGFPLFSSYPVPGDYLTNVSYARNSKEEKSELTKFIAESKKGSRHLWLDQAQQQLVSELTAVNTSDYRVLFNLMEKVVSFSVENSTDSLFPQIEMTDRSSTRSALPSVQQHGVMLVVRYGCQLHLLASEKDATEKLTRVIRKLTGSFRLMPADLSDSKLACLNPDNFVGFDWFAATVFLMTAGNSDRTEKFLSKFSALLAAGYVWTKRLHGSAHVLHELAVTGMPPAYFVVCHHIEHILQLEVPNVYSAFKMSGYSPAQICQHWLRQCFWNYLDWPQICAYIAVCVTLGADYSVYMCVAVLRHLQRDLMQHLQDKNLVVFLKEEPIQNFRFSDNIKYMQELQVKFRSTVLADMKSITN
jgi:hypothetical protein